MLDATITIHTRKGKEAARIAYKQPERLEEMSLSDWLCYNGLLNSSMDMAEVHFRLFLRYADMDIVKLAVKAPDANPLEMIAPFVNSLKNFTAQNSTRKCFFTGEKNKLIADFDGMGENLTKMTFKQFGMADSWMMMWLINGDQKSLNNFCAAFFTFKDQNWSSKKAREIQKYFEKFVPMNLKTSALRNFQMARNAIEQDYKSLFPATPKKLSDKSKQKPTITDWDALTLEVAETGIFGIKPQVEETPAREILKFLDKIRRETKSKPQQS